MTKMEEKSINEERNDEVEKNQFFKSFDEIFETFFKILDFNELDVNRFLSFKDSKSKYGFYIMIRILTIILEYSLPMFPIIIGIVYPSLFGNSGLTTLIISVIIIFPVSISIFFIRKFFDKKYDYSMAIFRKEKKKMNKYCKQLNLIIHNRYVIEELGEKNYTNNYKNKIKRINNRVDYFSQLFKPLNHYIIQFGLISMNLPLVRVSGGEPTIFKEHLLTLLVLIPERITFILETNGILLDKEYVKELSKFENIYVRVSLKGVDEETFEKITGAEGKFFLNQLHTLELLKKYGIRHRTAILYDLFTDSQIRNLDIPNIEYETLIRYPFVLNNLNKRGISIIR
ncbi:MAG: hypothetical protein CEE43_16925 [Promethearchaeota archaeon Loki_b32]|nr:MAG: hypothetical protein CEE43_16925 [Candidatus Lokiarchaeota archaeon Loki_b32]